MTYPAPPATPNQELAKLLSTHPGRRIHELLKELYGGDCFNENPFVMARLCGNREVVLDMDDLVAAFERKESSK